VKWQAEIAALLALILLGSLGMWYTGSQYFLGDEEVTVENTGENSLVGWGGSEGSGSGTGSGESPSTPTVDISTEISASAKVLLAFIGLGVMVGTGIGILIARIRVLGSIRTAKIEKSLKVDIKSEILDYIKQRGAFTISELVELTKVSESKIERYIKKLVKRGMVKPSGEGGPVQVYVYTGKE